MRLFKWKKMRIVESSKQVNECLMCIDIEMCIGSEWVYLTECYLLHREQFWWLLLGSSDECEIAKCNEYTREALDIINSEWILFAVVERWMDRDAMYKYRLSGITILSDTVVVQVITNGKKFEECY